MKTKIIDAERIKHLQKENARLREALKFYAELDGNGIQLYGEMDSKALEFIDGASFPFGQTARDALKGGENGVSSGMMEIARFTFRTLKKPIISRFIQPFT